MTLFHSGASELAQLMEGITAGALIPQIVRRGFQDLLEASAQRLILGSPGMTRLDQGRPALRASLHVVPATPGSAIETLPKLPVGCPCWFVRTAAGAAIDLLLEWPDQRLWAIEVKRSLSPRLGRRFHQARADLQPEQAFVVISAAGAYPLADGVEVLGLVQLSERMHGASAP